MGTFSGPKFLAVQIFFNALWAGLTNPRDILDSFNENPLDTPNLEGSMVTARHLFLQAACAVRRWNPSNYLQK